MQRSESPTPVAQVRRRTRFRGRAGLCLVLATALVCALAGLPIAAQATGLDAESDATALAYIEDELIIVYEDEVQDLECEDVLEQEEIVAAEDGAGAITVATIASDASVEELCQELLEEDGVAFVQPNYSYSLLATTDDPYATDDAEAAYNQYYLALSGFTSAWDTVTAEGSVTVAVIDTGCNLEHEDLADTVDAEHAYDVTTETLLAESGVANNGDSNGHGTMVCGVISATADNACGIAGASYNASVLPIRIFDDDDSAKTSDLLAAYAYLDELVDTGELDDLRVINLSLGYYTSASYAANDEALYAAIESMLEEHGVLTVCAGGNSSSSASLSPADFDICLAVISVDTSAALSSFSDYNEAKDLAAYGEDVLSTSADGGYATLSGTSMAAPQVAAAAALVWAANPDLSADEVVEILLGTASETSDETEVGVLDAAAAVAVASAWDESGDEDDSAEGDEETADSSDAETDDAETDDAEAADAADADDAGTEAADTTDAEDEAADDDGTEGSTTAESDTEQESEADASEAALELLDDAADELPAAGDACGRTAALLLVLALSALAGGVALRRRSENA